MKTVTRTTHVAYKYLNILYTYMDVSYTSLVWGNGKQIKFLGTAN